MSKETESKALEKLEPYKNQDSMMRLRDYLRERIETHRDSLEKANSDEVRGQLKEARKLFSLLSE